MATKAYFLGKNIVLTGGATGIGKEIASLLLKSGANLLLVGRRESLLKEVQQVFLKTFPGQNVEIVSCDISDRPALEEKLPSVLKRFNPDMLINNAGIPCSQYFLEISPQQYDEVIDINFLGSVNLTRMVLPYLLKKREGHVSFVSSVAGLVGIVGYTAYSASKFAMNGFAEALRNEFKDRGISVSVLYPPDVQTPLLDAESATMPVETKALNNSRPLNAHSVAQVFLNQMARKRFAIYPTIQTRFTAWLLRHFPNLVMWYNDRTVQSLRAKRSNL